MSQRQIIRTKDIYSKVTDKIIEHLEKGVIPWRQTWDEAGIPKNVITGKEYRGINTWILAALQYPQNYFLTFHQIQEIGGRVKKGEKAQEIVFWKWLEREDKKTGETERIPMARSYYVFNISQCEDLPKEKLPLPKKRNNNPIETCEKIVNEMPNRPVIKHTENRAYYNKVKDFVNVPPIENFDTSENYYNALFHELLHSTGHTERLNRKELLEGHSFGSDNYALEELTAEMGASYLKSIAGIPMEQLENNAAYIKSWLEHLKNDKRLIFHASAQAQKATDYILNYNTLIVKDFFEFDRIDRSYKRRIVDFN
jgi:antirestriction protein ArdC